MPTLTRTEVIAVMRRTGHTAQIPAAEATLPDVLEIPRDRPLLERLGLNVGGLMEDMGDSP